MNYNDSKKAIEEAIAIYVFVAVTLPAGLNVSIDKTKALEILNAIQYFDTVNDCKTDYKITNKDNIVIIG